MYTPTPDIVADAFDLGRPIGELVHVRRGDTDTWRLETTNGGYFIKGYRPTTSGQFVAGDLLDHLEVAMDFERSALQAGVDMAEPILPRDPLAGWVTRINERLFRAYPWIEHRALRPDDDIADWLGRTMAQIHQMQPVGRVGLPDWWRGAIRPRATWQECLAEGQRRGKSWSELAQVRLPLILDASSRIEELCEVASDCVKTHGDFKTHNMLMTPTGPVLVDWDSVRVDSAALEAGRVAFIVGAAELKPIRRILRSYAAAGGDITCAGQDLFLSVVRHDLQGLLERIRVSLGQARAAWWMGDSQAIEQTIHELLRELPHRIEHLNYLASKTVDITSS